MADSLRFGADVIQGYRYGDDHVDQLYLGTDLLFPVAGQPTFLFTAEFNPGRDDLHFFNPAPTFRSNARTTRTVNSIQIPNATSIRLFIRENAPVSEFPDYLELQRGNNVVRSVGTGASGTQSNLRHLIYDNFSPALSTVWVRFSAGRVTVRGYYN